MKSIAILTALFFTAMVSAQIVNIPDPNFKAALIDLGIDTNSDGQIQESEANATTFINLGADPLITSIEGIRSFTNLMSITISDMPQLTAVDLSNMAFLQGIGVENSSGSDFFQRNRL
ncbi:MAG: hypothetical protein QM710_05000 [Flavobacterium sp.]